MQFAKSFTTDLYKVKKGTMSASQYIDNLTKGLTGTGILGVGALMADLGLITASQDSDTKNFDNMQGKQAYALNIGDKTYTLDWATPAVLPLFVGAEVYNVCQSEGYSLDDFMNALSSISQPMMETSMLDGLNSTLESIRYSDDDDNLLATIAGNTATSYLKQGVPTVLGQAARTLDNTRRSTYTEKEGVAGSVDRQLKQIKNKIPVLSESNQPYVDAWGREQSNLNTDNLGQRLFYQTMSPGYLQDVNTTPVDSEIQRLYDSTKDASVMPDSTENKVGGVRLTEQEYTDFAKKKGQTQYDLVGACLENDYYNSLDDEGKAKVISDMYSLSKKVASAYVKDDYTSTDKVFNIYQEGGAQAVLDYMKIQSSLGDLSASGGNIVTVLRDNKNMTDYQKGEYIVNYSSYSLPKTLQPLADNGDYEKVYQYYNIKNSSDSDGNGYIRKEEELIPYLTGQSQMTNNQKNEYVQLLFPDNTKTYF